MKDKDMPLCVCGCKTRITWKNHYRWRGIPKYIHGHYWLGRNHSEESKRKMSESRKGRKLSEEHKNKVKKFHTGRKHSKETKNKISESKKGIPRSKETKKKLSEHFKGKKRPKDICKRHSELMSGENNPNWKGGISNKPYCEKWTYRLKEGIREQYGRKCFSCNKHEKDNTTKNNKIRKLSVHHVYYDKEEGCNNKEFTLVPLCMKCHTKTNYNRDYWQKYFIKMLESFDGN